MASRLPIHKPPLAETLQVGRAELHHLCHGFAGLMLASGAELATVSHMLGHSSVARTASPYAGIAPSLRADAVNRLGRLLQQPG